MIGPVGWHEALSAAGAAEAARHPPRWLWALAAVGALLLAGVPLLVFLTSPGELVRLELEAAAGDASRQLWLVPSASELAAMRRDFYRQQVTLAPVLPDSIAVTLHGLDRHACLESLARARRLEGAAVVVLQGYRTAVDCRARNDMTWLIMP